MSASKKFQKRYYERFEKDINYRNLEHYTKIRCSGVITKIEMDSSDIILDLGCGDGLFSRCLLENSKAKVVGIDLSYKRITFAKKKVPDAFFVIADAEHLPFKNNSFNVLYCNALLHHMDMVEKIINEISRVIYKDGIIIIIEPNKLNPLMMILAILNKAERSVFNISTSIIIKMLMKKLTISCRIIPLNSYIYPYQCFPPKFLLKAIKKVERIFEFKNLSTHHLLIVTLHE